MAKTICDNHAGVTITMQKKILKKHKREIGDKRESMNTYTYINVFYVYQYMYNVIVMNVSPTSMSFGHFVGLSKMNTTRDGPRII